MPHGNKRSKGRAKKAKAKTRPSTSARPTPPSGASNTVADSTENTHPNHGESAPPAKDSAVMDTEQLLNEGFAEAASNINKICAGYKQATERFIRAIQAKVPPRIFGDDVASVTCNSLMDAVDYLLEHHRDLALEHEVMGDLGEAIRSRKRAMEIYSDGDAGHAYFVQTLSYCWSKLCVLSGRGGGAINSDLKATTRDERSSDDLANAFDALKVDEESEDEQDDGSAEPLSPSRKDEVSVSRPEVPDDLTFESCFSDSSGRMDAMEFLVRMELLMRMCSDMYRLVKKKYFHSQKKAGSSVNQAHVLMKATLIVNACIAKVSELEQDFASLHPHLNTPYRLLGSFYAYFRAKKNLYAMVARAAPDRVSSLSENELVAFCGDCLECAFRDAGDPKSKMHRLIKSFSRKWGTSEEEVTSEMDILYLAARLEAPMDHELKHDECQREFDFFKKEYSVDHHHWMKFCSFIGGDRSMTSTLRLLQHVAYVVSIDGKKLGMPEPGSFGPVWNGKAKTIPHDMDDLLMTDILPQLLRLCADDVFDWDNLPFLRELSTFLSELRGLAKHPTKPVSWSLIFAVHALLTSIFEVQDDDNGYFCLSEAAKESYIVFHDQVSWVGESEIASASLAPKWTQRINFLKRLYSLSIASKYQNTPPDVFKRHNARAFWNPICAGSSLLYISYAGNLAIGCQLIDQMGQLTMVLHLYNALLKIGVIKHGDVEHVDWLFDLFKGNRSIWKGVIPERGEFVSRWLVVMGFSKDQIRTMKTKMELFSIVHGSGWGSVDPGTKYESKIVPEGLSVSFRQVCLHDSSLKPEFCRDILDAFGLDAASGILSHSLISLSRILDECIHYLFRVLGLASEFMEPAKDRVREAKRGAPEYQVHRQARFLVFCELVLNDLDRPGKPGRAAKKAAWFLKDIFEQYLEETVTFSYCRQSEATM